MSTLKVDALTDGTTTKTLAELLVTTSGAGTVTSWAHFDGTGTAAINDDDNIASITDNGTGDYTFTFTSNVAAQSYGVSAIVGDAGLDLFATSQNTYFVVGSMRFVCLDDAGTATDPDVGAFQQNGDFA